MNRWTYGWLVAATLPLASALSDEVPARLQLLMDGDLGAWEERSFSGHTEYRSVVLDGERVIQAQADGAASSLYINQSADLSRWPVLSWEWRINRALDGALERHPEGDDFVARIYVIDADPVMFWRTRAICYVWSGVGPKGSTWSSPYSDGVRIIALQAGDSASGQWMAERRVVAEDFRHHFGEAPRQINAVAIMTDTDNTGARAVAWYRALRFESRQ